MAPHEMQLGQLTQAVFQTKHQRKQAVFHVMYGAYPELTEAEMASWRSLCAEWINGSGRVH